MPMISLVRRSKLRELREASPLTGLPGNLRIRREIHHRIAHRLAFAVCHVDIDQFKSINDAYGFVRGDEVILLLAKVLRACSEGAFVGHIGGDDFVVICPPDRVNPVLTSAIADFERRLPAFYDPIDVQRGYVISVNRRGEERHYAMATLSIGVASSEHRRFADPSEAVTVAAEMKTVAKSHLGSHIAVDRRRGLVAELP